MSNLETFVLKYFLVENPLRKEQEEYTAKTVSYKNVDENEIINEMLTYNSTATKADIKAVLEVFYATVGRRLLNGFSVKLPIVNLRTSITGTFTSAADAFDSTRHKLCIRATPGKRLTESLITVSLTRTDNADREPRLKQFTDCFSNSSNAYHAGFIGKVTGKELNFDRTNPDEGLFIVNVETGSEIRVSHYATITYNTLMFNLPELTVGTYQVEVRKCYCSGNDLRTGNLKKTIQIV